jgi:hypothetical protein
MKNLLDLVKSTFEVLKQVLIVAVLICLLFYPTAVGQALVSMGVTEGDVWGFKWKADFKRTDERLNEAHAALAVSEQQLAEAAARINELTAVLSALEAEVDGVQAADAAESDLVTASRATLAEIAQTIDYASATSASVERTLVANAPIIARADPAPAASGNWAVVAGGDRTVDAARDELARARAAGFEEVRLVERNDWIRTVILFSTRTDATQALPNIQDWMRRRDAYVVEFERWCPDWQQVDADLVACGAGT